MKRFHDLYSTVKFNNFRDFITTEYGIKMVISHFDSYLICEDEDNAYEIKFEVDFDNNYDSEVAHIINLCNIMGEMIENTEVTEYSENEVTVKKIIKATKLFGKTIVKTEDATITFTRRNRYFMTYDIAVHEEVLKNYELYPA